MFGKPKKVKFSKEEQKLLDDLYSLIMDKEISDNEREILLKAKNLLETGDYTPNVIKRLYITLQQPAVKQEMTPKVAEFFNSLSRRFYKIAPFGSNLASLQVAPL